MNKFVLYNNRFINKVNIEKQSYKINLHLFTTKNTVLQYINSIDKQITDCK